MRERPRWRASPDRPAAQRLDQLRRLVADRSRSVRRVYEDFLTPDTLYALDDQRHPRARHPLAAGAIRRLALRRRAIRSDAAATARACPISSCTARDMPLNGQNPTLLYAYGGFQVSYTPSYSALMSASSGSSAAASMCSPTSAAAASSAPPGTRPACAPIARSSTTISTPSSRIS